MKILNLLETVKHSLTVDIQVPLYIYTLSVFFIGMFLGTFI